MLTRNPYLTNKAFRVFLGASILVAQAMERNETLRVNQLFSTVIRVLLTISLLETIAGLLFLQTIGIIFGCPENLFIECCYGVRIVEEEFMTNIVLHSKQRNQRAYVGVRLMIANNCVTLAFADDGSPFNPVDYGLKRLGLTIVNGASSQISYKYQFWQNMTMVKIEN